MVLYNGIYTCIIIHIADFDTGPYVVKFPANNTSTSFNISLTNDKILENNETFHLFIDYSQLPDGIVVDGSQSICTVTIVDTTGMYVNTYIDPTENTLGVKKQRLRTKKARLKRCEGDQGLLLLMEFLIMTKLQNLQPGNHYQKF